MKGRIEGVDSAYLYKYCSSSSGGFLSWFSNDQTKQFQFEKWNKYDYNFLILKDSLLNKRMHISFSFGDNDCDYVDILNPENKDITFIHDTKMSEIQKILNQFNQKYGQNYNNQNQLILFSGENNIKGYGRIVGRFMKVVLVNMHIILCLMLISIQMKYYEPGSLQDAPSHIRIIFNNLTKIILSLGTVVFLIMYLQKLLFTDGIINQQNYKHNNLIPVEYFASSFLSSFVITFATVSTYIFSQFAFQACSFFSYLVISLLKYIFLKSQLIVKFTQSKYFSVLNEMTLIFPFFFLLNYYLKWVLVFIAFWILLGLLQSIPQQFGHSINIIHGFAYLILLYFLLNASNLIAGSIQFQSRERNFKNLMFSEDFPGEYISMIVWIYLLTKIENLVCNLRTPLQICFILLSLFLFFFIFQSVSHTHDYICSLSFILLLIIVHQRNQKSPTSNPNKVRNSNSDVNKHIAKTNIF